MISANDRSKAVLTDEDIRAFIDCPEIIGRSISGIPPQLQDDTYSYVRQR